MKKQKIEGQIATCKGSACSKTCCDDDEVQDWMHEYFAFHEPIKQLIKSWGIEIKFKGDRVNFKQCSDGASCKFLKYAPDKNIDPRPIDCKIYPFFVDWDNIDFDKKIVALYYWDHDCPLVRNKTIPDSFKEEVEQIIKRDFKKIFFGAVFEIKFINKVYKPKK